MNKNDQHSAFMQNQEDITVVSEYYQEKQNCYLIEI